MDLTAHFKAALANFSFLSHICLKRKIAGYLMYFMCVEKSYSYSYIYV